MRPGACALTLGVGLAHAAEAQGRVLRAPGAEFFAAGVSRLATAELDDRLAARGYPPFGRSALAVSLGGYRILSGGLALGAEWHGVIQGSEARGTRTVGFGGGYGTVGVGYAVQLSRRARLYPRLGVGGGGLGVWIERPAPAVGFDEVLDDPDQEHDARADADRQTVLRHGSIVVDVGAGAELMSGGRGRGPLLGVRLGYLAMPFRTNWRLGERPVTGGPAATLAGPYVRVVVGTGRRQ
jgi:hypothetical protein